MGEIHRGLADPWFASGVLLALAVSHNGDKEVSTRWQRLANWNTSASALMSFQNGASSINERRTWPVTPSIGLRIKALVEAILGSRRMKHTIQYCVVQLTVRRTVKLLVNRTMHPVVTGQTLSFENWTGASLAPVIGLLLGHRRCAHMARVICSSEL